MRFSPLSPFFHYFSWLLFMSSNRSMAECCIFSRTYYETLQCIGKIAVIDLKRIHLIWIMRPRIPMGTSANLP